MVASDPLDDRLADHDALDDPDFDGVAVQDRPLFDVQLDIGSDLARRAPAVGQSVRVASQEADPVADTPLAEARQVEFGRRDRAVQGAAAVLASLLVGPDDDLERVPEAHARIMQSPRYLDRAHDTDHAVVVAAVRYRVDV